MDDRETYTRKYESLLRFAIRSAPYFSFLKEEDIADLLWLGMRKRGKVEVYYTEAVRLVIDQLRSELNLRAKKRRGKTVLCGDMSPLIEKDMSGEETKHSSISIYDLMNSANIEGRKRRILLLYVEDRLSLKQIGVVLGVSESRVSQLMNSALDTIRDHVKNQKGGG